MKSKATILMMMAACICLMMLPSVFAIKVMVPPSTEQSMPNGLKVIVVENHEQPVVSMRLLIKTGTAFDPANKAGLASMTANLLDQGTATRDANEIAKEIDFMGGSLDASSDLDATYATCEVLTKHFDTGLKLLSDIILNPTFPQEEIDRVRKRTIGGLMRAKDDPNQVVAQQYRLALFGSHPYAQPGNGTVESVGGITKDDITGFWQKYYIPNNSVLFVVGDVKPADIMAKVGTAFSSWKQGTPPEMNFPEAPQVKGMKIILINKPDATQSNVKIGHLGINRYNPDIYACRVMNYVLGGGGFVSRMMADIRAKRGLTYDINSQFAYQRFTGDFTVTTFTRTDSTAKAVQAAIEQLQKIRQSDVTPEELSETVSFYSGFFPRQFETPQQVANQMSTVELYGLGKNYLPDYIDNIAKVTAKDVRAAAQKYIHPDDLLIVVVGKADAIRESLKKIAPVTEVELSDL